MLVRFWKWLGLHVHDWTKWEEDMTIHVGAEERLVGTLQTRACKECGFRQRQRVHG